MTPPPPTDFRRHIPNALTLSRVALAGGVFLLLALEATPDSVPLLISATALFILAAITDALDGYLARKWRVVSAFGRVMDPFADKILILGSFIMLAGPGFAQVSAVAPWIPVVILGRELLVTSIRGVYESRGVDFSADWTGKLKMILQSICIPLVLVLIAFGSHEPRSAAHLTISVAVWATLLVTVLSGVNYVRRAIVASRSQSDPDQ